MLHSYPQVYQIGHKAIQNLFEGEVVVQEKVDGSQLSWGIVDGELQARSKGKQLILDAPEKMFERAVAVIRALDLCPEWVYRAEFLEKPKHNTIAYSRIPKNHIILYDICTGQECYAPYEQVVAEGTRLGLEVVPQFYHGEIKDLAMFKSLLDTESILGGAKIEGVVVKNYCVTPEHLTLTSSLDWVPIGDLVEGDCLIAPTESGVGPQRSRYYRDSIVEWAKRSMADVLEIEFSDGSKLRCTANHPLLVIASGKVEYVWREATRLKGNETIKRLMPPWKRDNSYESGYLAGIFDGEGHIIHHQKSISTGVVQVGFSQNPGVVIDSTLAALDKLGFKWLESAPGNSTTRKFYLSGGKSAAMRFLGTVRPERLLGRVRPDMIGGIKSEYSETLSIRSIKSIGRQEIVELQTSSSTYLTDGLVSHNSIFTQEKKVAMGKYVSEDFKETNAKDFRARNPTGNDITQELIMRYKTEARWRKAIQHLKEQGQIEGSPRDIGLLIREIPADIQKECEDEIKETLFKHFWKNISRGITAGCAEWYKQELLKSAFPEDTHTQLMGRDLAN